MLMVCVILYRIIYFWGQNHTVGKYGTRYFYFSRPLLRLLNASRNWG